MKIQHEDFVGYKTSPFFSSAKGSHQSCILSMLLAHPEGNSQHLNEVEQFFFPGKWGNNSKKRLMLPFPVTLLHVFTCLTCELQILKFFSDLCTF